MDERPLISVLMGIYNCANTLDEAVESIINQTYENWELIMCDDCSTDGTLEVATDFVDRFPNQIKLLRNKTNKGLNFTLNKCLETANGQYIARMDGDDVCNPDRFMREVEILKFHPEIAIVSTDMYFFDKDGVWGRTRVGASPDKYSFLRSTPFCHAACMVRREAYQAVGGYTVADRLLRVEDYHLWVKMYEKGYRGINIQEPLYSMRDDRNAQKRKKYKYRMNEAYVKGYAIKHLGLPGYTYLYCMRPLIIGLLPPVLYKALHRKSRSGE